MPRRHRPRLGEQGVDRRRRRRRSSSAGTEPSTPRSAAAHSASVSGCALRRRVGHRRLEPSPRPPHTPSATASAAWPSSASSNRSPTSSWGRARSPAAAGRWVVTRVCAQWASARNAPSPDEPRVARAAVRPGGSRPPRPRTPVVRRGTPGAAAPPAPTARRARGPGWPGPRESGDSPSSSNRSTSGAASPATAAVNRIRRGSPRMRASQALSRGSAWDRGSRTGAGHEGGYAVVADQDEQPLGVALAGPRGSHELDLAAGGPGGPARRARRRRARGCPSTFWWTVSASRRSATAS